MYSQTMSSRSDLVPFSARLRAQGLQSTNPDIAPLALPGSLAAQGHRIRAGGDQRHSAQSCAARWAGQHDLGAAIRALLSPQEAILAATSRQGACAAAGCWSLCRRWRAGGQDALWWLRLRCFRGDFPSQLRFCADFPTRLLVSAFALPLPFCLQPGALGVVWPWYTCIRPE